jgi:putative lipoprotein
MRALIAVGVALVIAVGVAGCTSSGPKVSELEGTWRAESFGAVKGLDKVDPSVKTTITFKNGQAEGNGGVNSFGGSYEAKDGGKLKFGQIAATEMAGSDAAMKQESRFFEALGKTRGFEFNESKLVLTGLDNDTLVILVRE